MSYSMESVMEIHSLRKDIRNLKRIFSFGRPARSDLERYWVDEYLCKHPMLEKYEFYEDGYGGYGGKPGGNIIVIVGDNPKILWSCHTDTVHRDGIIQNVFCNEDLHKLSTDSGQCLGGDDGTGVWIMLEFLKAGMDGVYVFHRAEEVGGQGSSYIANSTPELLENVDFAIAFDRKDNFSIITSQGCSVTASDRWSQEMADALGMGHRLDPTGSFTDTRNYDRLVSECTNFSVGYFNAHRGNENQDYKYIRELRDNLIRIKDTHLKTMNAYRDPQEVAYSTYGVSGYGGGINRAPKRVRDAGGWNEQDEKMFQKRKQQVKDRKEKGLTTQFGRGGDLDDDDDEVIEDEISSFSNITRRKSIHDMTDKEYADYERGYLEDDLIEEIDIIKEIVDDVDVFFDDADNPAWQGLLDTVSQIIGDEDKTVDDLINPKVKDNTKEKMIEDDRINPFEDGLIDDVDVDDEYEQYDFEEFFKGHNF
jgi:hypothetical protein